MKKKVSYFIIYWTMLRHYYHTNISQTEVESNTLIVIQMENIMQWAYGVHDAPHEL